MSRRPRYMPHPDKNQPAIIKELRECGFLVVNVSRWLSIPDLFVWGYDVRLDRYRWTAWELKVEEGELTDTQRKAMAKWPGAYLEARDVQTILEEYGRQ